MRNPRLDVEVEPAAAVLICNGQTEATSYAFCVARLWRALVIGPNLAPKPEAT